MTAATLNWSCLQCPAAGVTTGTESGQDAKHCRAEGHATNAHAREWAGDGRVAG